jgi:diamine N-acetyltransferase
MVIRKASLLDVSALVTMNASVQIMHSTALPDIFRRDPASEVVEAAFRTCIESSVSYWLVAEESGIVGFLSAEFSRRPETWYGKENNVCYLAAVVVAPAAKRKGVAKALLAELKKEALIRGAVRIELDVWSFNSEAKKAFVQLGFHSLKERMALSVQKPNQPLEPMGIADTPRADARVAPAIPMAHH